MAQTPYTLAQIRDEVRRLMEIVPPVDSGTGNPGDAPLAQVDPSNTVVNSAVNQAISAINRVVRVGPIAQQQVTVPAATANRLGKQYVDISGVITTALSPNEIEDVIYLDSGTGSNPVRLLPYEYYAHTKTFDPFQQFAPAKPQMFVVSGTQIGVIPPSAAGGTLYFDAASGIPLFALDTDSTSLLPDDYQWAIMYWAVAILSSRKSSDIVAQARAQKFGDMAKETTLQIWVWRNGYDQAGIQSVRSTLQMMSSSEALQAGAQPGGQGQAAPPPPPGQGQ